LDHAYDSELDPVSSLVDNDPLLLTHHSSREIFIRVGALRFEREEIVRRYGEERSVERLVEVAIFGRDGLVNGDEEGSEGGGRAPKRGTESGELPGIAGENRRLTLRRPKAVSRCSSKEQDRREIGLTIRKCSLYHHLVQQRRDVSQHMSLAKEFLPFLHELSHRMLPISDELVKLSRYQRRRLRLVELESSSESFLSQESDLRTAGRDRYQLRLSTEEWRPRGERCLT
jgi:hypothetical protein